MAVDYDPGASEVNQLNRIKLMISVAKSHLEEERERAATEDAGALVVEETHLEDK